MLASPDGTLFEILVDVSVKLFDVVIRIAIHRIISCWHFFDWYLVETTCFCKITETLLAVFQFRKRRSPAAYRLILFLQTRVQLHALRSRRILRGVGGSSTSALRRKNDWSRYVFDVIVQKLLVWAGCLYLILFLFRRGRPRSGWSDWSWRFLRISIFLAVFWICRHDTHFWKIGARFSKHRKLIGSPVSLWNHISELFLLSLVLHLSVVAYHRSSIYQFFGQNHILLTHLEKFLSSLAVVERADFVIQAR